MNDSSHESLPKSIATEPSTPEPLPIIEVQEESSAGDFATLTPSSKSSRLAFHNLVTSFEDGDNWETYHWHRRYIHVRESLQALEDDEEESTGGEGTHNVTMQVRNGYWRLNMDLRPSRPQFGWFIGRGRWQANSQDVNGAVDILLTGNAAEPLIRGRHARFIHNLSSNRLLIQAEGTMKFNGETLIKGDRRELPKDPTTLSFGTFEYNFTWTQIDQDLYRKQLDSLAEEVHHDHRPPLFMTPTPQASEYLLDKYRIRGTFATGSSCIVCAATDSSGNPFAVKKIIAKNRRSKLDVDEEVRNMRKLMKSQDAPESISRFVELLTIDPSGPSGVYECYIVTQPLIATTLAGILKSDLSNPSRLVLVSQILQGLDFIHSNGCMHRDIKLDNILGSAHPLQACIIDFGHATWEKESSDHMKGTVRYLAPEVIALKQGKSPANLTYNQSVDIWSTGLTIFEFMCQWRFNQTFITTPSHRNLLNRDHWNKQHASDQSVQTLFDLLSRMLAWVPEERFTARDCLNWAIQTKLGGDSVSWTSPSKHNTLAETLHLTVNREKRTRFGSRYG